ncbi:beta-phosphoglucomutase [Psychroflexus torquis ATCC 700755]|uniref:Beta-phosphoglucomutase n=1 Tax=Psychroflexus torquis (strain ATCC 700755 / CIP 106069 / ACAM 623) TaxID=313595 RepID=K4IM35_PSYTT|nr:beta-phosphoglucomutase [Psychroflexus torquis]AFU70126.1 beta-phosphoglucomutase [Psychroflexus torquis ATCC 700755]
MTKAFIFDLDGVIVDTAKFHYLTWKNLADSLGIPFSEEKNEQLKGVSRAKSLEKILEWGHKILPKAEFESLMFKKNEEYLSFVNQMTEKDILPGVMKTLDYLRSNGYAIALGSASKNARLILSKVGLEAYFEEIIDGNEVTKAKPDPEVFLKGIDALGGTPKYAIVFEDSLAGIEAANTACMTSVGIGDKSILKEADFNFQDFIEIDKSVIETLIKFKK